MASTMNRTFVRSYPQPLQTSNNFLFCAFHITFLIRIFNAQNELPARFAGK